MLKAVRFNYLRIACFQATYCTNGYQQLGAVVNANTVVPGSTQQSKLKMRGWQIHNYGGLEELQFSDKLKMPQIRSPTDCLVRVHATAINPIDVAMLGGYGAKLLKAMRCDFNSIEFPLTLGREFCGELVQTGMGFNTKIASLGERVWGVVPLQLSNGAHADYVVVPDYCISRVPEILTDEEATSVLYAGLTAWSGLYVTGQLGGLNGLTSSFGGGAGKRILVLGGAGGVGSLAIQMLKANGAHVAATCSEDAVELVKCLGADYVVDYKNPIEFETLRTYAPFDIVLDCAGQGAHYASTLKLNFKQYITFSSPLLRNIDNSGFGLGLVKNVAELVETNLKALKNQGGLVKFGFFAPAPQGIEFLNQLVERKKLLPQIDSCFNFDKLPEAFKKVQDGHLRGKVVVILKKANEKQTHL